MSIPLFMRAFLRTGLLLAALCGSAWADEVRERAPIKITVIDEPQFGRLVVESDQSGTATLSNDGYSLATRGGLDSIAGGSTSAGRLRLKGEPNARFIVSLPSQSQMQGGGGGVVLRELRVLPSPEGTFDGAGNASVTIIGTLSVSGGARTGTYRAPLDVLVDYQ